MPASEPEVRIAGISFALNSQRSSSVYSDNVPMKTFIIVALLGSLSLAASAQDTSYGDSTPAVVYNSPVIYQAPVLYQMPVVYYAPVYYLNPPPCEAQPEPAPASCAPCAPSVVVVIGGQGGAHSYSHYGNSGSTVIHFGAQQACAYGYQFNLPR